MNGELRLYRAHIEQECFDPAPGCWKKEAERELDRDHKPKPVQATFVLPEPRTHLANTQPTFSQRRKGAL